jgi:ornithine decarboxylase
MIPRDVKSPTRAIPLHKLLNVMAIVDRNDAQTKELLDYIKTDGFEVEVCEDFEDASELMSLWLTGTGRIKFHTYVVRE